MKRDLETDKNRLTFRQALPIALPDVGKEQDYADGAADLCRQRIPTAVSRGEDVKRG